MRHIFNTRFHSLSALMVPFTTFLRQVNYVEKYSYNININHHDANDQSVTCINQYMYTVPYVYTEPIIADQGFVDRETAKQMIDERALLYAKFAISINTLKEIDADTDTGVLVSLFSGQVIPFQYSTIESLMVNRTSAAIPDYINIANKYRSMINEFPDDAEREYLYQLAEHRELSHVIETSRYLFSYQFIRKPGKKDKWNPDNNWVPASFSPNAMITKDICDIQTNYILDEFNAHAKVILTV